MVDSIVDFIGKERFAQGIPEYRQGGWLVRFINAITTLLTECFADNRNWTSALTCFEGIDSIPLMTIHKSKGLEFHAVYFVGLDDNAWWSFSRDRDESMAGFFVSFTRAAQRIFYTYCPTRGTRQKINELYKLFENAGVPHLTYQQS